MDGTEMWLQSKIFQAKLSNVVIQPAKINQLSSECTVLNTQLALLTCIALSNNFVPNVNVL